MTSLFFECGTGCDCVDAAAQLEGGSDYYGTQYYSYGVSLGSRYPVYIRHRDWAPIP